MQRMLRPPRRISKEIAHEALSYGRGTALAADGMSEAKALQKLQVEGTGRASYSPETAVKFKESDNVFVKSDE